MFLGFVLAVISARGSQKLPTTVAVLVPLLVLALLPPETMMAVARRLYWFGARTRDSRRRVRHLIGNLDALFRPDHIHHRLLDLGLSHRPAVLALYCVGGASAVVAFVLTSSKPRDRLPAAGRPRRLDGGAGGPPVSSDAPPG
jgi:UDP-GlcNAc:undecaprenyl-phosphate GlcNAc-1-phosphate transferase